MVGIAQNLKVTALVRKRLLGSALLTGERKLTTTAITAQVARSYEEMPGPKPVPFLGNKFRFMPGFGKYDFGDLFKVSRQLYDEFGPIVKFSGLKPKNDIVFVFDPKDIETMIRGEGPWPHRPTIKCFDYYRKVHRKDMFKGLGGLVVDQGKDWQEGRHQANPIMMQIKIVQMYTSKIDEVAEDLVKKIPDWMDSKNEMPEDFKNELNKWALESIAMIALDTRLGCLEENLDPNSDSQKMIFAVRTLLETMHNLEMGVEAFLWQFFPTPSWKKFVAALDCIAEVSHKHIHMAIEKSSRRPADQESSALERLLQRDPNPNRAIILAHDMLFGGIDTTAVALANLLLQLSEHQNKQEILFQELKRIMPDPHTPITSKLVDEMKYLKACIKESMRMMPVVNGNLRKTEKEIILSNYKVPPNVEIMMSHGTISRFNDHFREPEKFIPERWIRGHDQEEKANPFVALPFGHGARKCIGMRFALLELQVALAKMVRRFRWEFKYGPMKYKTAMVHTPVCPLKFTVHKR